MHEPLSQHMLPEVIGRLASGQTSADGGSPIIGFYDRRERRFAAESQRRFAQEATAVGRWLRVEAGVAPGTAVVIAQSRQRDVLLSFLGAIAAACPPTITASRPAFDPPEVTEARLAGVVMALGGNAVILADESRCEALSRALPSERVLAVPADLVVDVDVGAVVASRADDICYFQLTSGSTGLPKALAISHGNIAANSRGSYIAAGFEPDEVFVTWLPLYHDMGLVGKALLALTFAMDIHFLAPYDFLADPLAWLRAISDTRATMSVSPTFGFELAASRLERNPIEALDLSSWRHAFFGAEPISLRVAQRVADVLGRHGLDPACLRGSYGMAETTLLAALGAIRRPLHGVRIEPEPFLAGSKVTILDEVELNDQLHDDDTLIAASGRPMPDTELWLVDDAGERIDADDVCGEIHVGGPQVAIGALTPAGELAPNHGQVATGDLGFLHDGEVYIVDRIKNIVIRRGVNYAVTPIEEALATAGDLERRRVMVIDSDLTPGIGRVTALVEVPKGGDTDELAARLTPVALAAEPAVEDLLLLRWSGLPATTSGKKRHGEARRLLAAGALRIIDARELIPPMAGIAAEAAIGTPEPDPVLDLDEIDMVHRVERLTQTIADGRGFVGTVAHHHRFTTDLRYDSLALYELAMAVEENTGVLLPEDAIATIITVGDLVDLVRTRHRDGSQDGELGMAAAMALSAEALPQALLEIDAQEGRELLIADKRVVDFASCNYLAFDLHPDVIDSIAPMIKEWGVHPSWTRAVASPAPYRRLERRLAELVGAPDTLVFPTLTLQHIGVMPLLAAGGTILIDNEAHHSMQEAAELCSARGVRVVHVAHRNTLAVAEQLAAAPAGAKLIVVDGVYSTTGSFADLPPLVDLARRFDAQIYVDDAHGFGLVGERPSATDPLGHRGNGIVQWYGLDYDHIVYAGGLSKAYSSMAAFVTVRSPEERRRFAFASTAVFSGPIPVASLASAHAGLDVNDQEGDERRRRILRSTLRLIHGARELGFEVDNETDFPIVTTIVGSMGNVKKACDILWEYGLLITPAAFPAAPLNRGGLRFTVTAANTDEHVDLALRSLRAVRDAVELPQPSEPLSGARGGT